MAGAAGDIYTMLANADLKHGLITDEEGQEVELTEGRYNRYIRSRDRRVRREAFERLHASYAAHRNTCAAAFAANVKADLLYARARHYPSALEAALYGDNIPPALYHNLIDTVHAHLPLQHRYLALRRRALGL